MRYQDYLKLFPNGRPYSFGDGDDVSLPGSERERLYQEALGTLGESIKNPTANGWIARSNNIPTFEQWAAGNPEVMGDNDPRYQYLQQFYEGTNKSDIFETLLPALAMSGMAGAAGGMFGNLSTYGSAGGTFGSAASVGGDSVGFFDDILNMSPDAIDGSMQTIYDTAANAGVSGYDPTLTYNFLESGGLPFGMEEIDGSMQTIYDEAAKAGLPGYDSSLTYSGLTGGIPGLDTITKLGNSLKSLFGGGSGGGFNLSKLLPGGRDLFGSTLALAPSLAAINYAKNQGPFDISKLDAAYSQVDPNSLAREYDINTDLGRNDLVSSLTSRGVIGSSFGDQSLTNFNTSRDIGRKSLLTSGAATQANIASQILNAQIKEREQKNNLYGRALLALSGGLMPRGAF
jgi:hypothetical protein